MSEEPTFEIVRRPERRYSPHAGFEYEGGTVFSLSPVASLSDANVATSALSTNAGEGDSGGSTVSEPALDDLLTDVLGAEPYTYGDWFDLPMVLYLVHDADTGDVFRVAVRDDTIELHTLPSTEPPGLRGLYRRLCASSGVEWRVERRASAE